MIDTLDLSAYGLAGLGDLATLARVTEARTLLANAGTCAHPIRLIGGRDIIEAATGRLLDSSTGQQITVNCGNRRATKCAHCSTLYKYDAYNLVVAGLRGGKDVPASVAAHPQLFVTLTAPSFGPVHLGPDKKGQLRPCKPRRDASGCRRFHPAGDPLIGTPLDPASYDYTGHVLFNAMAGKLWSLTTTEIRRSLARLAGLTRAALADSAAVTFAKVAEYQARGIIHFHAVIRLDGPDGPASMPPSWASAELLEQAVRDGAARATVTAPESRALGEPDFAWGRQLDVKHITPAGLEATGQLSDVTVARYIAKYATKSAETAGVELPPMACRTCHGVGRIAEHYPHRPVFHRSCGTCGGQGRSLDLDAWPLTDHARRLIETCWLLGAITELADLRLRQWAHTLGFRGHFATKSRTYSTTFGALRAERADYTRRLDPELSALADSPDVLVINHWAYAGPADTASPPGPRSVRPPSADLEGVSP